MKAIVSATRMATHLGLSRPYLDRLTADGTIKRRPDGRYDQDQTRLDYLRWLREARRRSPNSESRSALERARARAIELRNAQTEGKLMMTEECLAIVDELVGLLRTHLSGLPARCTRDLALRRAIEAAINETLERIADLAMERAEIIERQRIAEASSR